MSQGAFQVVQFVHPGFEYSHRMYLGGPGQGSGVMGWKQGKSSHDRKFMLSRGSLFDRGTGQDHPSVSLAFWGEWEGPSVFWRMKSPGQPLPSIVHVPFRPAVRPTTPIQNTDPMVFGGAFIYSNCMQPHFLALRTLRPGSIILFGRFGRPAGQPSFGLDTCLVIDELRTIPPIPEEIEHCGSDLLRDAVLRPLLTEGWSDNELTVYFGRRPAGDGDPFSFFPAQQIIDSPPLFARPRLRPTGSLDGVVNPSNPQGIKSTPNLSASDRDAVWSEVARQVAQQACGLGYEARPPPVLTVEEAHSASRHGPSPLDG